MKILVTIALLAIGLNSVPSIPLNVNVAASFLAQSDRRSIADRAMETGDELIESNPRQATQEYERAVKLYNELESKRSEALAWLRLGIALDRLGEKQPALDALQQALTLIETSNATPDEKKRITAEGTIALAGVYQSLGEYEQALALFEQALVLNQQLGERVSEVKTLIELGSLYQTIGELEPALEHYQQAAIRLRDEERLLENLLLEELLGDAILSFSVVSKDYTGDYWDIPSGIERLALAHYTPVLQASRGVPKDESRILNKIGTGYSLLGEYPRAIDFFQTALPLAEQADNPSLLGSILFNSALVYQKTQQYSQALDYYQRTLPLLSKTGNKTQMAETRFKLAQIKRINGNLIGAKTDIEAALVILENLRATLNSDRLRTVYFATIQEYYQFYIDLLMQLHQQDPSVGYDAQAFDASERSRARSLLELLAEASANIRQGVDPQLLEKEQNLLQQLNALERRRHELLSGQYSQQQLDDLEPQSKSLLSQLDQLKAQIRVTSPRYANLKYPQPLTLEEIQQQILDEDTLLLEYSLGEERSYLWAVTQDKISSYELPPESEIAAAAESFRDSLQNIGANLDSGVVLSQMILTPVASQLSDQRLLVVGDGILQLVSFAALPISGVGTEGLPLLVNHEIVTLSSASTVAIQRQQLENRDAAPKTLAVIADPVFSLNDVRFASQPSEPEEDSSVHYAATRAARDLGLGEGGQVFDRLNSTRTEAEKILALVPKGQQLQALGFQASRDIATDPNLAQYQIIHLATHGLLDPVNPQLSGVVLSLFDETGQPQNGFLRLHDIFNLNLPAELVVLSACQTGLGEQVKGEGLVGLTRGFMYAGARRVAVSLWSVDDVATAELMTKFYHKMLAEKQNPVAALRAAQLEMWNSEQWQSPYYWAAFTVQGDWQ
jgi:CHAT domain-containing protein/tetratricopeptide (TPR) repeat protein